jgi:hypothetical protein
MIKIDLARLSSRERLQLYRRLAGHTANEEAFRTAPPAAQAAELAKLLDATAQPEADAIRRNLSARLARPDPWSAEK